MISFLLDTNVISAHAPDARPGSPCAAWLKAHLEQAAISVVTIAEIESGIAKGASRKAALFSAWLGDLERYFEERILPFDVEAARIAGLLQDKARSMGRDPGFADIAIAATGVLHGLTLATQNVRDFDMLGIAITDPSTPDVQP